MSTSADQQKLKMYIYVNLEKKKNIDGCVLANQKQCIFWPDESIMLEEQLINYMYSMQ